MDAITALALSIHNPLLSLIGHLLDRDFLYEVVIIGLLLLGEWENDKRLKILLSLVFAFVLGWTVKLLVAEPRPCLGAAWCPLDYAFPSTHAVVAFTLMAGFLNKRSCPFFLVFALFVSFTRLNLGVHTFVDIIGAIPTALAAYYAAGVAWAWLERRDWLKDLGIAKKGGDSPKPGCKHGNHDQSKEFDKKIRWIYRSRQYLADREKGGDIRVSRPQWRWQNDYH